MICMGMGVITYGYLDDSSHYLREGIPAPHSSIYSQNAFNGSLASDSASVHAERQRLESEYQALCIVSPLLGLFAGAVIVIFLWHLRRPWYYFALILPAAASVTGWLIWRLEASNKGAILIPSHKPMISFILLQTVGLLISLYIARPVVRTLLRFLLPPPLLAHMAFLWRADNKVLSFSVR